MARRVSGCFGALLLLVAPAKAAEIEGGGGERERRWGVALGLRYADTPFAGPDESAADILPLFYYEGERVFLNGLEGGVALVRRGAWRLNTYARYRFPDFPRFAREGARSDSWDIGLQLRHAIHDGWDARWELLSDGHGRSYLDVGIEKLIGDARASLRPYAGVRIKSSGFNDRYFGLGRETLGAGVDLRARVEARLHLYRNLYLLSSIGGYRPDSDARRSGLIEDDIGWEAFAGVGVFNDPAVKRHARLTADAYWRVAHGWATGSNLGDILLRADAERDPHDNRLTSLFYGHPLADEVFGWPLAVYLTPGLVYHHPSEVQGAALEYVIAVKGYYTAHWPVRVRFGLAEGLSYASQVSHIERTALEAKDHEPSKFLNYLDVSIDVNAGDLLGLPPARRVWLGFAVHHRSGIFETGSQFGRIGGGSNYSTFYLQWHF